MIRPRRCESRRMGRNGRSVPKPEMKSGERQEQKRIEQIASMRQAMEDARKAERRVLYMGGFLRRNGFMPGALPPSSARCLPG